MSMTYIRKMNLKYNNKKITDKKIVEAFEKMNNPKYSVTKSLNRLLHGGADSCDACNVIEIVLYGKPL